MILLKRLHDGRYSQGTISKAIKWKDDGTFKYVLSDRPSIDCSMLVGRNSKEFLLTTKVVEILEDTDSYVKFKTKNSTYEWKIV